MNKTPVTPQTDYPKSNIPYRVINHPFRFGFIVPGKGITIEKDSNGILYISSESGMDVADLVAGDNIDLTRTEDGKIVVSAVNTVTDIAAGQNVSIDIDPETGTAIINTIVDGVTDEHFKGIFDTPLDLMDYDTNPEQGDYGLIKKVTYSDGGEQVWNGEYKYCFWIDGSWTVVDQMLTFSSDTELLKQFFSVGGGSPVIYLHTVARTGDFNDLANKPIVATPEVTVEGSTVTATCDTEGAEIHYTKDGSIPYAGSTKYSGPITVGAQSSFRFVAVKNGLINSEEAVVYVDYDLQRPLITLNDHTGIITLVNPNEDGSGNPIGEIHYTTDGTTPTIASPIYEEPFTLSGNCVVKAIVIDSDNNQESGVRTGNLLVMAFGSRTYGGNSTIGTRTFYISPLPESGSVHYTIDGSNPDYESPVMSEELIFDYYGGVKTIKSKAYGAGYIPSSVDTVVLGAEKPVSPPIHFNPDTNMVSLVDYVSGRYGYIEGLYGSVRFSIGNLSTNSRIYYTLDGSEPSPNNGNLYTGDFEIHESCVVKAVLVAFGQYYSDVATQNIVIVQDPICSLDYRTGIVTMQSPSGSGTIYYTLDGTTPQHDSPQYSEPIQLTGTTTIKMVLVTSEGKSGVVTVVYEQAQSPELQQNNVDLSTGTYDIVMRGNSNSEIRYTDDESDPTYASELYQNPVTNNLFDGSITYKAILFEQGKVPSLISTITTGKSTVSAPQIAIDHETGYVTMALTGNTVNIPLQTNNNVPSMGARIWYTLDGTEPSAQNGTLWTGVAFRVDNVGQIRSKTICYGHYESATSVVDKVRYLTLTAEEDVYFDLATNYLTENENKIQMSINNGDWETVGFERTEISVRPYRRRVQLLAGDFVKLKGHAYRVTISSTSFGKVHCSGVPNSFYQGDGAEYDENLAPLCINLFDTFYGLVTPPELPATTLTPYCYESMFIGCRSLASAPELPATVLAEYCYRGMFRDCVSLTSAPELPATVLAKYCYHDMFWGCDSLTSAPELPATVLAEYCYGNMFRESGLMSAPELPATTLAPYCYYQMFYGCGFASAPELPATLLAEHCYDSMFRGCTSLTSAPELLAAVLPEGCYQQMFRGCVSLEFVKCLATTNVNTNNSTTIWLIDTLASGIFVYTAGVTWPSGASGIPAGWKSAAWNTVLDESDLTDDDVAIVLKNTTTGNLGYMPKDDFVAEAFDPELFTIKPYIRFTRGKNGRPVLMHKNKTSGMWAEFNRYRLACDTTQAGGFDWAVAINGTAKSGTVSWQPGDTLDSILAQLNTQAVATYLVFSHESGEAFIRIRKGGYSNSTFTLSNNTGATLTDLSFYTKIGDVQQAEVHREWQADNVNTMFPSLGFLPADTAQYAVNGYNLSYMCGGNETQYKAYYRTHGSSSYLAENAVSSRMSEAAFNAMDGSGDPDQQALYDKYGGSWDAYMEASMAKIDDTNAGGIEYLSYDDGDVQTSALASVTTMDFDGSYIAAFPCAANCQRFTDTDIKNGKFNMCTEHELIVCMRDAKMAAINSALDILIAQGMTADKLSAIAYRYMSVARFDNRGMWLYNNTYGRQSDGSMYYEFSACAVAYPVEKD